MTLTPWNHAPIEDPKRPTRQPTTAEKTTRKKENKHQPASEIKQRSLTEADQKHKPKIKPSKGGGGESKEQTLML